MSNQLAEMIEPGVETNLPDIDDGGTTSQQEADEAITNLLVDSGEVGLDPHSPADDSIKPLPQQDAFKAVTGYDVAGAYQNLEQQAGTVLAAQEILNDKAASGEFSPQQAAQCQQQLDTLKTGIKTAVADVRLVAQRAEDQQREQLQAAFQSVINNDSRLLDSEYRQRAYTGCINQLRRAGYSDADISAINDPKAMQYVYNNWLNTQKAAPKRPKAKLPKNYSQKKAAVKQPNFKGLNDDDSALVRAMLGV